MGLLDKLKQAVNDNDLFGNNAQQTQSPAFQQPVRSPQPTQSVPLVAPHQSSGDLYNSQLEELIEMALMDGELTEKEKQILFKKAESFGIDLDEFEMVLEAKLFEKQQRAKQQAASPASNPVSPKSDKYGDVKKCPSCGAIVQSFSGKCRDCGYEFRDIL